MTPHDASAATSEAMAAAVSALPVLEPILAEFGTLTLAAYMDRVLQAPPAPLDLLKAVYDETADLFGADLARRTATAVEACAALPTANHHGVDFFAQSVQENLMLALQKPPAQSTGAMPILAFSNVALGNLTYPRGLLIYDPAVIAREDRPLRCPLFPASERRRPVATAPALTIGQINGAIAQLRRQRIDPRLAKTAIGLLADLYLDPALLAHPDYLHQAAHLNRKIWKRLFTDPPLAPELVFLAAESVTTRLLSEDLRAPESLAYRCFFDPPLRRALINALEGIPGCWKGSGSNPANTGSVLFWGLDRKGRLIGLDLIEDLHNGARLESRNGTETFALPLDPAAVYEMLAAGRLLPTLYTCFLEIALARRVVCLGGYYQISYLPQMQAATAAALDAVGDHDTARKVAAVATDRYFSGMLAIMLRRGQALFPAGPVEIIACGGLSGADLDRMANLKVGQAHLAGLFDTLADAVPPDRRPLHWATALAQACGDFLHGAVTVKDLSAAS